MNRMSLFVDNREKREQYLRNNNLYTLSFVGSINCTHTHTHAIFISLRYIGSVLDFFPPFFKLVLPCANMDCCCLY